MRIGKSAAYEAKLASAVEVMKTASTASRRQLEIIQREGFVFDGSGDRWEKLAFTLYSALVETSTDAAEWLKAHDAAATQDVSNGRGIQA